MDLFLPCSVPRPRTCLWILLVLQGQTDIRQLHHTQQHPVRNRNCPACTHVLPLQGCTRLYLLFLVQDQGHTPHRLPLDMQRPAANLRLFWWHTCLFFVSLSNALDFHCACAASGSYVYPDPGSARALLRIFPPCPARRTCERPLRADQFRIPVSRSCNVVTDWFTASSVILLEEMHEGFVSAQRYHLSDRFLHSYDDKRKHGLRSFCCSCLQRSYGHFWKLVHHVPSFSPPSRFSPRKLVLSFVCRSHKSRTSARLVLPVHLCQHKENLPFSVPGLWRSWSRAINERYPVSNQAPTSVVNTIKSRMLLLRDQQS